MRRCINYILYISWTNSGILNEDTTLANQIRTLFREQGNHICPHDNWNDSLDPDTRLDQWQRQCSMYHWTSRQWLHQRVDKIHEGSGQRSHRAIRQCGWASPGIQRLHRFLASRASCNNCWMDGRKSIGHGSYNWRTSHDGSKLANN